MTKPTHVLVLFDYTEAMHKALLADQGFPLIQWENTLAASPNSGQVSREQLWKCIDAARGVPTQDAMERGADIIAAFRAIGLEVEGEN